MIFWYRLVLLDHVNINKPWKPLHDGRFLRGDEVTRTKSPGQATLRYYCNDYNNNKLIHPYSTGYHAQHRHQVSVRLPVLATRRWHRAPRAAAAQLLTSVSHRRTWRAGAAVMASSTAANGGGWEKDVFLSHDWTGHDGKNHERVVRVHRVLTTKLGVRAWLDVNELKHNVYREMAEGIRRSSGVLVFITKRYHDKINDAAADHDNCEYEYDIALTYKGKKKTVPIIMEEEMQNPKEWQGTLMALGSKLYVSLTDIDHLCDEQLERRLRESLLPKVISWLSPRANTAAAPGISRTPTSPDALPLFSTHPSVPAESYPPPSPRARSAYSPLSPILFRCHSGIPPLG